MNIHLIIDFNYNYHKHVARLRKEIAIEESKVLRMAEEEGLSVEEVASKCFAKYSLDIIEDGKTVTIPHISFIYFPLRDIERNRSMFNTSENNVVTSICVDSRSKRKDENEEYKANRVGKLNISDFDNINRCVKILGNCGYNVYKEDGMEADDLISSLVEKHKDKFDLTVIFTNDSDILVNVSDNVLVYRYKSNLKNHVACTVENLAGLMSEEWNTDIRYNTTMLYKCLVGDSADGIKGISGFGKKAFNKFMRDLDSIGGTSQVYAELSNEENVRSLLNNCANYFGQEKLQQALDSLELVAFKNCETVSEVPIRKDTLQSINAEYAKYQMKSLIK